MLARNDCAGNNVDKLALNSRTVYGILDEFHTHPASPQVPIRVIRRPLYPADTRKSVPDQEMWPSDFFATKGGVCAGLACDVSGGLNPLSPLYYPPRFGLEAINF
jgi:hypothetical protein